MNANLRRPIRRLDYYGAGTYPAVSRALAYRNAWRLARCLAPDARLESVLRAHMRENSTTATELVRDHLTKPDSVAA